MRRILLLALAAAVGVGCARSCSPAPARPLAIPHASHPPHLDGELSEQEWHHAARTGPFVDIERGGECRPYSDARFMWYGSNLYLGLYAADQNIVGHYDALLPSDDHFTVRFHPEGQADRELVLEIEPSKYFTSREDRYDGPHPWAAPLTLGVDMDGTLNDPRDEDEEWVVEAALPFSALGLTGQPGERIGMAVSRCDTPFDGHTACGAWGWDARHRAVTGTIVLALGTAAN